MLEHTTPHKSVNNHFITQFQTHPMRVRRDTSSPAVLELEDLESGASKYYE
jgi:hypothetical protein